jgi:hypothetical protein
MGDTIVIDNTAVPTKAILSLPPAYDKPPFSSSVSESPNGGGTLGETVTIPPDHLSGDYRTLVLCFVRTGDQFDADNSKIVQLVPLLKKSDWSKQMVYYQVGCFYAKRFFLRETKLMIVCVVRRGLGRTLH